MRILIISIILVSIGLCASRSNHHMRKDHHKRKDHHMHMRREAMPASSVIESIEIEAQASANSTQCIYSVDSKLFSCRGDSGDFIECPADANLGELSSDFKIFGMSKVPEVADQKLKDVKFWMFPRNLDNTTYSDHFIIEKKSDNVEEEQKHHDIFFYHSEHLEEFGFRVQDEKCFERIAHLFNGASVNHMVSVNGDENGISSEVSLFGEVLMVHKQNTKRFLFGGLGLGFGFPFGGFGWGFPFGGFGFGK
jgi:hypothetical protein